MTATRSVPGPSGRAGAAALRDVLDAPMATVEALAARYGRTFAIRVGPLTIVVVGDRDLVHEVLSGPQERYRWGPMFKIPLGVFVGPTSLLVSDGDDHARRRYAVQPAFALRRLNAWRALVLEEIDRMIDGFPLATRFDLAPRIQTTIRRVVVRVLFGDGLDPDVVGETLAPAAEYVNRPMARQIPHPFPFGARQQARAARRRFDALLDAEIDRRRAGEERGRPRADDVLDTLLTASFTRVEVRDQVVSLIGAGYDTTTAAASWLVLRAAPRRDVWEQLRAEADASSADAARPWADAVVHEALRIHPAGAYAPRLVWQSFGLGPYRVRRGSIVAWSPLLVGRDPDAWPDPLRFDPRRHLDAAPPPHAWAPFGGGARSCLGFGLARMNLTLLASRLAQRCDLHVASEELPAAVGTVTAHPAGGVPVTAAARP
ncbi:MAG: cytochrome P450 [Acidimicrobiales bacterium]